MGGGCGHIEHQTFEQAFHSLVWINFLDMHCFTKDHIGLVLEQAVVFGKERRGRVYV